MENAKIPINIPCPIHPSEPIQRISLEKFQNQQRFYCVECLIKESNHSSFSSKLIAITELVEEAANFYSKQKQEKSINLKTPNEYDEILVSKAERLEKLNLYIEDEKKKVVKTFDAISETFIKVIEEQKEKYLNSLDQQMGNLDNWFTLFEQDLGKVYPSEEKLSVLFPTKESLVARLGEITTAEQLEKFIDNLKGNIEEINMSFSHDKNMDQSNINNYLDSFHKALLKIVETRPFIEEISPEVFNCKIDIQSKIEDLLGKMLRFRNPISDIMKSYNFESTFVKPEEFDMLKELFPKDFEFKPKLLYRASRDGFTGSAFHEKCDGKSNTLTFIKAQFRDSNQVNTIGGFLDGKWVSNGSYIQSDKAFLFSTTLRVKCPVECGQYAGYGHINQGPTFGGGHDLIVISPNNEYQGYLNPHCYSGTAKLGGNNSTPGLNVLEVEVYCLN